MKSTDELKREFQHIFGTRGGAVSPGNVGQSRRIVDLIREIMNRTEPLLFDYFVEWDGKPHGTAALDMAIRLAQIGQWEGAWALAQLHYDQCIKQEATKGRRVHKGHPLCNIALLARLVGSPALHRHYALMSCASDVCWEHEDLDLANGGLSATLLEQFESRTSLDHWLMSVRERVLRSQAAGSVLPIHPDSFVAGRWFTETLAEHVYRFSTIANHDHRRLADTLLDSLEQDVPNDTTTAKGTRFEAAVGLLLAGTPGFEVDASRKAPDSQTDLVVRYERDRLARLDLPGASGLVECKAEKGPIGADQLRGFGAKCQFHRVSFGILVARAGMTGSFAPFANPQAADLARRRFQLDGVTILTLSIEHLRGRATELRGLQEPLFEDHQRLVFGERA
ncbi:MAG: restriction endonuclease [Pseudomonadota bacterium]|nr:restriction endonuclease [Pseudomonadota bacterium]